MEEEEDRFLADKVQALSDIELAVLLCLVADQHCLIQAEENVIGGLEAELRIVGPNAIPVMWLAS